jgi:hypothetical protein
MSDCGTFLLCDEAEVMQAGITNCHNTYLCSPSNPQLFHCKQLPLHIFGECGDQKKTGTLMCTGCVTADVHFLQDKLPFILYEVYPQVTLNIWLQHDGALPHFN